MARRQKTRTNMAIAPIVVVGLVLAMAQHAITLHDLTDHISGYGQKIEDQTSVLGLIVTAQISERALHRSGLFVPGSYVDVLGRRFVRGTISGSDVVYVRSASSPSLHVAVTLQIMTTHFNLRGIIHYGSAGATNRTLGLGDVHVPALLAFTGSWEWLGKDSEAMGQLNIGEFNYPVNGENLLGSVQYNDIEVYRENKLETRFWLPAVYQEWLDIAAKIKKIDSGDNCIIPSNCLNASYDVIVGLNSSSSEIYVNNPSYADFLCRTFKVSTVDTSAFAVASGAHLNGLPFIVFHGISNKAGISSRGASDLANMNAVKAVARFIRLLNVPQAASY